MVDMLPSSVPPRVAMADALRRFATQELASKR